MFDPDFYIPEPNTGCWLWLGALTAGYGRPSIKGKRFYAHRLMWEATYGPIPFGLHVLHRCDLPCCVNPGHLFLGTHEENMADMARKHRASRKGHGLKGEAVPGSKLVAAQVYKIREDPRKHKDIAKDYGVCRIAIWKIKHRLSWGHL